jgi:hypothetical protein
MYNLHYRTHIVFKLVCRTNSFQCQFQNMTKRKSVLEYFLISKGMLDVHFFPRKRLKYKS